MKKWSKIIASLLKAQRYKESNKVVTLLLSFLRKPKFRINVRGSKLKIFKQ